LKAAERASIPSLYNEDQMRRVPSQKSVTFDLNPADKGPQKDGSLIKGKQSAAKVSPDKDESQISYKIVNPKMLHVKNVHLSSTGGIPTTIKALDIRNMAVGMADGSLKIIDLYSSQMVKNFKFGSKIR
jgi:hypothetical protein